jgi:hypothetical protein
MVEIATTSNPANQPSPPADAAEQLRGLYAQLRELVRLYWAMPDAIRARYVRRHKPFVARVATAVEQALLVAREAGDYVGAALKAWERPSRHRNSH